MAPPGNSSLIVIGGGGHARVVIDALLSGSRSILGFTDTRTDASPILSVCHLGTDDEIEKYDAEGILLANGLGGRDRRRDVFELFRERGYEFATVVHPAATIARDVAVSQGVQIMAGAVVQTGCELGLNAIINTRASIDHGCILGAHVHVAPGATLAGDVSILEGALVGAGATIIEGIHVGEHSTIGAGSVVVNDVPARTTVIGVPARAR